MNRVVVQEGYEIPFAGFDGYRRKRRKSRRRSARRSRRGGSRGQQNKMKVCAKRWRAHRGSSRSYRAFMRDCLRK
jgi:hypothetical protein